MERGMHGRMRLVALASIVGAIGFGVPADAGDPLCDSPRPGTEPKWLIPGRNGPTVITQGTLQGERSPPGHLGRDVSSLLDDGTWTTWLSATWGVPLRGESSILVGRGALLLVRHDLIIDEMAFTSPDFRSMGHRQDRFLDVPRIESGIATVWTFGDAELHVLLVDPDRGLVWMPSLRTSFPDEVTTWSILDDVRGAVSLAAVAWHGQVARVKVEGDSVAVLWTAEIPSGPGQQVSLVAIPGVVVAATSDSVLGFDAESGAPLWNLPGRVQVAYGTPEGELFVADRSGVRRLDPATGAAVWTWANPSPINAAALLVQGEGPDRHLFELSGGCDTFKGRFSPHDYPCNFEPMAGSDLTTFDVATGANLCVP